MKTIKKLEQFPFAPVFIESDDNDVRMYAFPNLTAGIIDGWAFCNGQITTENERFLRAFAGNYKVNFYVFEMCANDEVIIQLDSGEIQNLY